MGVRVRARRGRFELRVEDDGIGFVEADAAPGHGLASMRRRAGAVGGRLDVASVPGRGTRVTFHAPVR